MLLPPEAYGPFGAVVVLGVVLAGMAKVIQALWSDHLRADQDDREQRDRALALAEGVVPVVKQLAEAQAAANKAAAARRRVGDREDS